MKKVIEKILKSLVKAYLKKYNPRIIAVTGSVGKTTTRKAITLLLEERYFVRPFEENSYNTEIGLPLSIFGEKVPVHKIMWAWVILKCLFSVFFSKDYDYLVLEMGADKPGDIDYFMSFIKPKISVVTRVSAAHLEGFKTLDNVLKEKGKIVTNLTEEDCAILNGDDALASSLSSQTKARVLTYGMGEENDIYFSELKNSPEGTECKISIGSKDYPFKGEFIGEHIMYSIMAAVCVGTYLGYEETDIISVLSRFRPVKGRMNLIAGIRQALLIDDSYNANPASMLKALETLSAVASKRRVAVLGTMNELGDFFDQGHKEVGSQVSKYADILVTVGEGGKMIADEAIKNGFLKESVYVRDEASDAGEVLKGIVSKEDTVLFKGSQSKVRLEKAIIKVMKNPDEARTVLVRQSGIWGK